MKPLHYLGPQGSFTHQAAAAAAAMLRDGDGGEPALLAAADVPQIMDAVQRGEAWGVIAWENNVEGYVVPNLDMLIDARDAAGFARVGVDIAFDAFVRPDGDGMDGDGADGAEPAIDGAVVSAHAHGLAQCAGFIAEHRLTPVPAASNAAACRDLRPGQVALGPSICGPLYGLRTWAAGVQDYRGARTEFLVLAPRDEARAMLERARAAGVGEFETIITFIPLSTGPGVLADLLDVLRDAGLNMTSFISRPIKGHDGTYSFIATIDAAPWQPRFHAVLEEVAEHGDWVKTLAVYPRRERPNPPVDDWMLPRGGVRLAGPIDGAAEAGDAGRELLW
ncbi:prephenate dehydratase [Bifidobacterium phasiani]|uniref:Prephenate dehydratase n=1 Tax=Bifidobacterium phasiani TaxID=2834431 RepID=A0ABS6W793_9BIFI|nr:prephenate dehydratase domain-containing protein [Bifidobacterium phasiani]MBW3082373.1 chorismate mutase [Bifidobacterium phasiani]